MSQEQFKEIIQNKKARFEYEILDTLEAGIVLGGTEVKSVRLKKVSINEATPGSETGRRSSSA
jgi:SsrA-binding protein